jgi:hypothetical protein
LLILIAIVLAIRWIIRTLRGIISRPAIETP